MLTISDKVLINAMAKKALPAFDLNAEKSLLTHWHSRFSFFQQWHTNSAYLQTDFFFFFLNDHSLFSVNNFFHLINFNFLFRINHLRPIYDNCFYGVCVTVSQKLN